MRGGDISNETPPRLIVLADVVAERVEVTERKFIISKETSLKLKNVKKAEVYQLWILTNKYGLSVELAGTEENGWDDESLNKIMDILDRRGGNPFNLAQTYITTQELVDDLPYRINLKGVVDLPSRNAMYGSWGIDLNRLQRKDGAMAADNEHRLVSKVIRDRDILPAVQQGITSDWFLDEDNSRVWKFVVKHYAEYSEVPTAVTVKDHYPTYKVLDVQDSLDFLVDQAVAFRRKLLVRQGLEESVDKLTHNDHEGALVAMEAAINRVNLQGTKGTNEVDLVKDAEDRFAEYQALANHTMLGIGTGFDTMDEATAGLQGGQLITIIAPPKTGKSQIAMAVAINVHKQGKMPMFQSFEMTNREQQQRHDAMRAQVSHGRLRRGKMLQDEEARYLDMLKDMGQMQTPFHLVDAVNGLTVASLSATISKLKPEVVFVDGVYLMMDEQTGEMNTPQSITNVTRALKRLAQRHDIPVVITTQTLLWKMRGGKVTADSIGYSSSFFQDSDVIFGLEPVPDVEDMRNFKIVASRNCGPQEVSMVWNWETGCFHEEKTINDCFVCKRGLI